MNIQYFFAISYVHIEKDVFWGQLFTIYTSQLSYIHYVVGILIID